MASPGYWLSASVLTMTSAPRRRDASMPAMNARASPRFPRKRTTSATPHSRAIREVPSVEPSSITSTSTTSNPATARGSRSSVSRRVPSSFRQGIWMTSFTWPRAR
jgi:hypothetical protein